MKKFSVLIILALGSLFVPAGNMAQEKKPEFKMIEFHMALLKRGPKWEPGNTKGAAGNFRAEHGKYALSLLESGKAVIAGPFTDGGDIQGIYILRAKSAAEAREWVESDPAVKSGLMVAEMHPWWSEDVMKKPMKPIKMTTAYFGFLKRGAKWTPERTAATAELQKAHIANIQRLAEMKKLVVAGPFGDNGELRGIFVFKVNSLDEARELAETDPAVQAGRLLIEMHPWLVPEGVLP
jgi:uncharacterized protein YciI